MMNSPDPPELSRIEKEIIRTIAALERTAGKAQTATIARRVCLSQVQTWRYLQRLETLGLIDRIGERGGWRQSRSRREQ